MPAHAEQPISPVTTSRPQLTISAATINDEPIELDSTPISPDRAKLSRRGSTAVALEALHADTTLGPAERERRAKLILERKANPAVLVDIPNAPGADELERSGAGDGEDQGLKKTSESARTK